MVELIVFVSTVILSITADPAVTDEVPTLMFPNPEVILPEFNAPTVVAAVVIRFGIAVISSSKYAAICSTVTCFMVPLSFITNLSPSTIVVDVAAVAPEIAVEFNTSVPPLSFTDS